MKFFKSLILFCLLISTSVLQAQSERRCGNEFAAYGLEGTTFSEALDFAGRTHNNYQEYLLTELSLIRPNFNDTNRLKEIIHEKSEEFFNARGFNFNPDDFPLNLGVAANLDFGLPQENYSDAGLAIMEQLQELINSYNPENDEDFFNTLNQLKGNALLLENDTEVFLVGVPVSVAIHSYTYWKDNGQRWLDLFTEEEEMGGGGGPSFHAITSYYKKCNVNLYKLGGADVSGAVSGAVGGGIAGPGGALAGGVLVSAATSLGNLTNQVISCYVSWWPF